MDNLASDRIKSPKSPQWTPIADQRLATLRQEGASMRSIALALRLSRNSVTERARVLGLEIPSRPEPTPKPAPSQPDLQREPLPAGHPISWGLLIVGSCLEGNPYTPPQAPRTRANLAEGHHL